MRDSKRAGRFENVSGLSSFLQMGRVCGMPSKVTIPQVADGRLWEGHAIGLASLLL